MGEKEGSAKWHGTSLDDRCKVDNIGCILEPNKNALKSCHVEVKCVLEKYLPAL